MKNNRGLIVSAVLVLLLFSAVIPVGCIQPAKADAKNSLIVQLNNIGGGITSLTNQTTHSSPYAAKLVIPSSAEQGSGCMVLYPYNKTLNSLQSFQICTSYTNASPRFVILLDTSGDGLTDIALLSDYQFAGNGSWVKTEGGQRWGWTEASPQLSFYGKAWNTTGNWKSVYGNATVLSVGVALEYWAVKDTNGFDQPLYADEVVINGVTYNIANQPTNTATADDWPMYRHDAQNTGVATTPVLTNNLLWQFTMGGEKVRSSPVVVNGIVYEGSNDGDVYALNAANGSLVWKTHVGNVAIISTPAVVNGIVYIGLLLDGYTGHVVALNATTGVIIWAVAPTGSGVESSPTVVDGVVYIGSGAGRLYALNAATGASIWYFATNGATGVASVAVVNSVVYVTSIGGYVYALNAVNGGLIWAFNAGNALYSSPAVVNNVVYVASDEGKIYALNAKDGSKIWEAYFGCGTDHSDDSPAVANGIVYIGSRNGYYAFNATTGSKIWFFTSPYSARQMTGYVYSSPAVVGDVVYFGSCDSYVFALNAFDGSMKWSYHTGGFLFTSPAIANGVLYIGSYDGKIYAIGNWVGQTPTPTPVNSVSTPAPTPEPTASPTATAQPDPTAKPASNQAPTEDPTSPPITEHVKKPVPAEQASIDWLVLAAIVVIGAISLISLVFVYRPNKKDQ